MGGGSIVVQSRLEKIQKLDEKRWREERRLNYTIANRNMKWNIRSQEITNMIGEFFIENRYESDIDNIYTTEEHPRIEE